MRRLTPRLSSKDESKVSVTMLISRVSMRRALFEPVCLSPTIRLEI
jgi:hypothetical protein